MVALEDWDVQDDLLLREAVEQGASLASLAFGAVRCARCAAARARADARARRAGALFAPVYGGGGDGTLAHAAVRQAHRKGGGNSDGECRAPAAPTTADRRRHAGHRDGLAQHARGGGGRRGSRSAAHGRAAHLFGGAQNLQRACAVPSVALTAAAQAEDALLALGARSLLLGPSWHPSNREARVQAAAQRRRDHHQLRQLERASRAATDRAAKGALATVRGMKMRYMMRKTEVRPPRRACALLAPHAARRRCSSAAPQTSRRWT